MAFGGNKTFKQQIHFSRIDLGNFQAVTDHRVSGRTAPLTKNILTAGKTYDVINGQKIMFVFFFGDERQFFFYGVADLLTFPLWKAFFTAGFGQLTQIITGTFSGGQGIGWILVTDFIQLKIALPGNGCGAGHQLC